MESFSPDEANFLGQLSRYVALVLKYPKEAGLIADSIKFSVEPCSIFENLFKPHSVKTGLPQYFFTVLY